MTKRYRPVPDGRDVQSCLMQIIYTIFPRDVTSDVIIASKQTTTDVTLLQSVAEQRGDQ